MAAMRERWIAVKALLACAAIFSAVRSSAAEPSIVVSPEKVELAGNFARAQLLVSKPKSDADFTARATYESSDPSVVSATASGELLAKGNGETSITVRLDGERLEVPVAVRGVEQQAKVGLAKIFAQ